MTTHHSDKTSDQNGAETGVIVLFGLDEDDKPRAARFGSGSNPALVAKAAQAMGLTLCEASKPDLAELAKKLPNGRLYANGRGFVPYVRRDLYGKLLAAVSGATAEQPSASNGSKAAAAGVETGNPGQPSASVAYGLPRGWDDIGPGHLVLAQDSLEDGWWEAVVLQAEQDILTLRWRDYPRYKPFQRHRTTLALLHPGLK